MRILLVGEYSRFHNSLKEGLLQLQHEVVLIGRKDSFKDYPIDISLEAKFLNKRLPNAFRQLIYRLTQKDIAIWEVAYRFYKYRKFFRNYDAVQLINEFPFATVPWLEKRLLHYIFKHNTNVFLSSCGDDFYYLSYILNAKLPYHILSPYVANKTLKSHFKYSLRYLSKSHEKLHDFVIQHVKGIIPANFDYDMAYRSHPKALAMIPFPINVDKHNFKPLEIAEKIIIFHGINEVNYYKKGNDIIEKALAEIQEKYPERVLIQTVRSLPYKQYIQLYDEAHIVMDQLYGYDQGYNALEAMAKGKVVFSGAETDFQKFYQLNDKVLINATPNVTELVAKLSELIENPDRIISIGENARKFVARYHDYKESALQYVSRWTSE